MQMWRGFFKLVGLTVFIGFTATVSAQNYMVTERGADYKVLQKTMIENGTNRVHQYTELATGLNYKNAYGQWTESKELISILPTGGAAATQGRHQVYFPADIYNGVLEVVTPDGKHLKSRPLGVTYDDGSNTVFIAVLTNSVGWLTASNQVTYKNCFEGIKADLVCTYRRGGFECDLVFREQPPTPDQFGLDESFTTLQLVTEFFNTQDPEQIPAQSDDWFGLQDTTLKFGKLTMTHGKAFAVGSHAANAAAVYKSWLHVQGRTFLIEVVPLLYIADDLNALPLTARSENSEGKRQKFAVNSSLADAFPASHETKVCTNKILIASADLKKEAGVVLDYTEIDEGQTDYTFEAGTTYYVSDLVDLNGTTTLAGDAIIKFNPNSAYAVNVLGTLDCQTTVGHPAIFTSTDDNSVGETVVAGPPRPACTGDLALQVINDLDSDLLVYVYDDFSNVLVNAGSATAGNSGDFGFSAGLGQHYSFVAYNVDNWDVYSLDFWPTLNQDIIEVINPSSGAHFTENGYSLCTPPTDAQAALTLAYGGAVHDVQIRNVVLGIASAGDYAVRNAEFVNCGTAFDTENAALYAGNILFNSVGTAFYGQNFLATAEQVTFDQGTVVADDPAGVDSTSTVTLANALLTGVSGAGVVAVTTNQVANLSSSSGVYKASGANGYHLATSSPYRNVGTTNIDPDLLAELQTMTTYAPQDGGYPDTNAPDLGYHYPVNEDSDHDSLPDWWEWHWFGTYAYSGTNLDSYGKTFLYDYQNDINPIISGLKLWLKGDTGITASDNQISTWADQSGSANNATQVNDYDRPLFITNVINSLPTVWFRGTNSSGYTNDFFNLSTNLLTGATGAEAFVVLKAATNHPSASQSLWEMGGDVNGTKAFPDTDGSIKDDFGSTTVKSLGIPMAPLNQFNIYQVSSQTNNWAAWLNGILLYQTNVNTVQFPNNAPFPILGMYSLGGAPYYTSTTYLPHYFAGNIAEVLVFNRALTTDERTIVNDYLKTKYGLVPTVALTAPTDDAVFPTNANITLSASASQLGGGTIKQVEFFQDTNSLGVDTTYPYSITWHNVAAGSSTTNLYALTARVTGDNGLIATSSVVNIMVDPPPTVSITNPIGGTYFGIAPVNITLGATASDIVGVSQVQFFQSTNGVGISLGIDTSSPYGITWSSAPAGNYALTTIATGNDGLTTTSAVVNVIVDADTDGDGIGDYLEKIYGTNPNVSDGFWIWTSTPNGISGIP